VSARDEVLAAAARRSAALVARDPVVLAELHHPDLRWTTHRGDVRDRAAYIAGNTEGDLVWRAQDLLEAEVLVVGDTAVLVGVVHDEFERDGEPGASDLPLTLTWVREEATGRVLAAHAGPPR
jgi:hypothetical protein